MTSPSGSIGIGVSVDAGGLPIEIVKAVVEAMRDGLKVVKIGMRDIEKELTRKLPKIKLDVELDRAGLTRARAQIRDFQRMADTSVRIKIDLDADEARMKAALPTLRALGRIQGNTARFRFDLDAPDDARMSTVLRNTRALGRVTGNDARFRFDVDADEARMASILPAVRALGRLRDNHVTIKIDLDVDEVRLARIGELLRQIRSQNVRINVNSDSIRDADRDTSRLIGSLGRIGGIGALGTAAVGAGMAAIGALQGSPLVQSVAWASGWLRWLARPRLLSRPSPSG